MPKGVEIDQRSAAEVLDQQQAMGVGEVGQRVEGGRAGESGDAEVAGMGAQDDAGVRVIAQRLLIVAQVRAVGRADLDQRGPALGDDVRHPEAAADLHQFAAGYDDGRPAGDRRQRQQDRAGAVVDRQPGLGAGHFGDKGVKVILAR